MSGKFAWVVEYIGFEVQNVAGRQRGEWNKDKDSKGLSLIFIHYFGFLYPGNGCFFRCPEDIVGDVRFGNQ